MAHNRNIMLHSEHFRKADESIEIYNFDGGTLVAFFKDSQYILFKNLYDFCLYQINADSSIKRLYFDEVDFDTVFNDDRIQGFDDIVSFYPENFHKKLTEMKDFEKQFEQFKNKYIGKEFNGYRFAEEKRVGSVYLEGKPYWIYCTPFWEDYQGVSIYAETPDNDVVLEYNVPFVYTDFAAFETFYLNLLNDISAENKPL